MTGEIISVGTELLLGHTINSDAAHIARMLAEMGIDVLHMQVVGDNRVRLLSALAEATGRSDLVFTTGGLGPTGDDLTKETVAEFTNLPLVEDAESTRHLQEYFGQRPMSSNQAKQALVPAGSKVFANSAGTAPGCAVPYGDKFIILLPGPPSELIPMLETGVRPFLASFSKSYISSTIVRTFGIGEGYAAEMLGSLLEGTNPTAATYAANGEMFVKVTAKAGDAESARALAMPLVQKIREKLGDVVYGLDVPSIEYQVVHTLINTGQTVATAESCTGGLLAKRITDQAGSSAVFGLGLVTYSNIAKETMLGVPPDMLRQWGAVSEQVAKTMARNIRNIARSDFGLGITGIAGPDGGSPEKPLGLVYIALAFSDGCWLRVMQPQGRYAGRERVRHMAASHALDLLRRYLQKLAPVI